MSRGRHPFDINDPFDDPFFKHFDKHMDSMFSDFFKDSFPTIIIGNNHDMNGNNNYNNINNQRSTDNKPDLSQINPNVSSTNNNDNNINNNNSGNYKFDNNKPIQPRINYDDPFRNFFRHFFEPEYDDHKLSDINPNVTENDEITNNGNNNIINSFRNTPGFRSPYLPNWNGVERDNKKYYRSESISIMTGPDGKTTKTTTINENGKAHTKTEEYDVSNDNGELNIFNFKGNPFKFSIEPPKMDDNYNDLNKIRNDNYDKNNYNSKFEFFKNKVREYNPMNWFRNRWYNYNNKNNRNNFDNNDGEWLCKERQTKINKNNVDSGWKTQSYSKYKHDKHSKLEDIVKNK